MISIHNLSKRWDEFSIKNINLDISKGEYFVILGPTGAGKTLLLELIAGFHLPDEGRIEVNGQDFTNTPPEERDVGFVYQDYSLFPHLTVQENIEFGLKIKGKQENVKGKSLEIMDLFDITHLSERYPGKLSGGERQKTALARALVMDPRVLLLDEPISALDTPSQDRILGELKQIHREIGITTIHVTHNRGEASLLGERIGIMSKGEIIQVGEPGDIFRKPKTAFIADFMGAENIFSGRARIENGITKVDIGEGIEIEATEMREGNVKAVIRPEEIIIMERPVRTSGRNLFEGMIEDISDLGSTAKLRIGVGREFIVTITKKSLSDLDLKVGKSVYIAFKASSVHVI